MSQTRQAARPASWALVGMFSFRTPGKMVFAPGVRRTGWIVASALQMLGFAAVLWLLLAGPGFLSDALERADALAVAQR